MLHGGRWGRFYSQVHAQFFKLEAAFGQRPEGEVFRHFINQLAPLCLSLTISGTSPSPLRSRVQTQPPYSRAETHRRRVTSWSPLGFRTDEEEEGGGGLDLRTGPSSSSDGWMNGPTAAWDPRERHQWVDGGLRAPFPFMW